MINLVPEWQRSDVRREYYVRLAVVGCFLASFCFLAAAATLVPSLILADAKEQALKEQAAVLTRSIGLAQIDGADQKLASVSQHLSLLASRLHDPLPTELASLVSANRTPGIVLSRLALAKAGDGSFVVTVGGTASTRETLVAFSDALKSVPLFSQSKLPVSDLAKGSDIPFTITITIPKTS